MRKKGQQKFTDIWANQTNLGKQFGLSPIAMGKKLKELKLRGEDGNPTAQALCQGYCIPTPLKDGTPFLLSLRIEIVMSDRCARAGEWRLTGWNHALFSADSTK